MFINNVTLSVLVTNNSEPFDQKELDMLKEMSSKGLIVESSSASSENKNAKNMTAHQFSKFLITEENKPGSYIFSLNYKQPQNADHKIGANIVDHAFRLAIPKTFPFSWYIFGFKLYIFMISHNINAISVSKDAMVIAEKLNMERPTVEAALEHLTENDVVLYFRDILPDTVFVSVNPFSMIFLELLRETGGQSRVVLSQSEFTAVVERYTDNYLSVSDFILLFMKLMILAPYKGSYVIPCFLPLLNEMERKEACVTKIEPLLIKCPSSGYEFIAMLTVYLLTLPNSQWEILDDEFDKPVFLYKNCIKFLQKEMNCFVTVSFTAEYLEICYHNSQQDSQNLNQVFIIILHGLEKIKLRLSSHQHFNFCNNLSFQCNCGRGNTFHTAVYNQQLDRLICEENKSQTTLNDVQRNWLKSGKLT